MSLSRVDMVAVFMYGCDEWRCPHAWVVEINKTVSRSVFFALPNRFRAHRITAALNSVQLCLLLSVNLYSIPIKCVIDFLVQFLLAEIDALLYRCTILKTYFRTNLREFSDLKNGNSFRRENSLGVFNFGRHWSVENCLLIDWQKIELSGNNIP